MKFKSKATTIVKSLYLFIETHSFQTLKVEKPYSHTRFFKIAI